MASRVSLSRFAMNSSDCAHRTRTYQSQYLSGLLRRISARLRALRWSSSAYPHYLTHPFFCPVSRWACSSQLTGTKPFEIRSLVLERLRSPGIGDLHAANLRLPGVGRGAADAMPPANPGSLRSSLRFLQDGDDLLLRERRSSWSGPLVGPDSNIRWRENRGSQQ